MDKIDDNWYIFLFHNQKKSAIDYFNRYYGLKLKPVCIYQSSEFLDFRFGCVDIRVSNEEPDCDQMNFIRDDGIEESCFVDRMMTVNVPDYEPINIFAWRIK